MKRFFVLALLALSLTAHADMVLREDTASQTRQIGPFVDSSGAVLTGLTISNTDVMLSKHGSAAVAKNSGGCTHDVNGMYLCTFDATDSSTVGSLQVTVNESGALPVYHEFQVAEEAVYDACCASGATVQSFPTNFASLAITGGGAITAGTVSDKTGYSLSGTQTFNNTGTWTGNLTGNVGGTVNGLTATAQGNIRTALGMSSANMDTQLSALSAGQSAIDTAVDQLLIGVNVEQINGVDVLGSGTTADPWNGE